MAVLTVSTSDKPYTLCIEPGSLSQLKTWSDQWAHPQRVIITQAPVAQHYLPAIQASLGQSVPVIMIGDGECHKTCSTAEHVWQALAERHIHRDACLLAIGGGVVSDITGFVAATYHRGIDWLAIPTTLLAQVDAAVGGKTGVNLAQIKNAVGAFHPPRAVLMDPNTCATLTAIDYQQGLAELVKATLIDPNSSFFELEARLDGLIRRDPHCLQWAITQACRIKIHLVEQDPYDHGPRRLLNLGHTIGHSIESLSAYQIPHGHAVALGLRIILDYCQSTQLLAATTQQRITDLMDKLALTKDLPQSLDCDTLIAGMWRDKKVHNGALPLIVLEDIGKARITERIQWDVLKRCIQRCQDGNDGANG